LNPFYHEDLAPEDCTDVVSKYEPWGYANKYEAWPVNEDTSWLCKSDADCAYQLRNVEGTNVAKCGAPADFNLTLSSDNVDK
jgi:hypothetical protein